MTDAVRRRDIATVGNGVAALDRFPRRMLRRPAPLLLRWMPADGRRIKNDFRAAQCGQARRFRIPLVPTNADADFPAGGLPGLEPEIARCEIKFLVIKWVVRNVHLAVLTDHFSIRI